ncbi:hypothetical protein EWB00_000198 [Schistosoma japonicum]|uniref:Uncharacterized protein n=1 Tax=Schistosoma japonicum TaxID=6182 RepID=A0A4Z2DJR3_SCHJA|nr:hypothetical protein EWB00_000198 [Schistosoma japonicum]
MKAASDSAFFTKMLLYSIIVYIFFIRNVYNNQYTSMNMLCPNGYWAAKVNITGGQYKTDRLFNLPYISNSNKPICQFCPNVGCFIVRLSKMETKKTSSSSSPSSNTVTSAISTVTTTTTTTTTSISSTISNITDNKNINETLEQINSTLNESITQDILYMSCDHWDNLPTPSNIIGYLDCVMIGNHNQFYLFIYEPRFQEIPLPPVDCVDANFLAWIKNDNELLGLELGFRMKTIPPFLFRYYQQIMQQTQYICIDGRSLANNSIPFEDTERFASNKLTQVVFRSLTGLKRERLPPKPLDNHHAIEFQSDEIVQPCPFIVQHKPTNITSSVDCQFSPSGLPTTSDKVSSYQALQRCPYRLLTMNTLQTKRRKTNNAISEEFYLPPSVLSACLLIVVLLLTIGIIIAFCVINHEKLMLCKSRSRKRREREAALAQEMDEKAAKEAAAAAAAAAEAEQQQQQISTVRHPIYARYGMIPPNMGGAFGAFAPTYQTMPGNMNISNNVIRQNTGFN